MLLSKLYLDPATVIGYLVEEDEMGGPCSTNWEQKKAYRLLVRKPEGKRPLGRPRRRWVNNIGWFLERWDGVMRTGLVWLRIGTGGELL
jgi:hypothetical protein